VLSSFSNRTCRRTGVGEKFPLVRVFRYDASTQVFALSFRSVRCSCKCGLTNYDATFLALIRKSCPRWWCCGSLPRLVKCEFGGLKTAPSRTPQKALNLN